MDKTRILFTHNTAMWYRLPFFKQIAEKYDLDLVFTHIGVIQEIYSEDYNNEIEGLEGVNYTILENKHGFAKGLIGKLRNNYDIVIGGSWDTSQELVETIIIYLFTRIKKEPLVIWREDWDWEKEDNIKEKILFKITKYLCNHADAILVPGSIHKEYFNKKLKVPNEKIQIMPNVSNITGKIEINKRHYGKKKVLYVGRLIERKGVSYLIEAFANLELDNCELIIVGSGNEEDNLKKYVENNNIENVIFTGKISNDELSEFYQESNLVVVPSINKGMGDPWVFVLNEAMYYGKPIVATTAVGAAPDMIKDNGFIVPEKDSRALCDAMYTILSDDALEHDMSLKSKEIINNEFQYSNMLNAFVNCVEKIVKEEKD